MNQNVHHLGDGSGHPGRGCVSVLLDYDVGEFFVEVHLADRGNLVFQGKLDELQTYRQEYIQLSVSQPEKAAQILTDSGWDVQRRDNNLVVIVHEQADAAKVNNILVQKGIDVFNLSTEKPSLEHIFLQLTNTSDETGA